MSTIKDVAKKAGVSVSAVSKALNDYDDISIELKEKIKKVASELNYTPNQIARSLSSKSNNTIGLLLSNFEDSNDADAVLLKITKGVFKEATNINQQLVVFTESIANMQKESYLKFCHSRRIDGLIILGIRTSDRFFDEIVESELPTVVIDTKVKGKKTSSVSTDNVKASIEVIDYLKKLNHENIGFIYGAQRAVVAKHRFEGYLEGLKKNNLEYVDSRIMVGDFSLETTYNQTEAYLKENKDVSVVFASSDLMALGFLKKVQELGLKVPEDISIVGFDNIAITDYVTPNLSTVSQDFELLGVTSVQLLIDLKNQKNGEHKNIGFKFLDKGSIKRL